MCDFSLLDFFLDLVHFLVPGKKICCTMMTIPTISCSTANSHWVAAGKVGVQVRRGR